jgi:hypothetical protein
VLCFADLIIRFSTDRKSTARTIVSRREKQRRDNWTKPGKASRNKSRLDPVGMWEPFLVEKWPMTADQVLFGFWDLANKTR